MSIPPFALVLTAAGSSLRFSSAFPEGEGVKKEFLEIDGHTVLYRAAEPFFEVPSLAAVVVTCRPGSEDETIVAMEDLADVAVPMFFIPGGETRMESVRLALEKLDSLPVPFDFVAIHDGARPHVTPDLVIRTLATAWAAGSAVPALPVTDSVRRVDQAGRMVECVDRTGLVTVQTPQIFRFREILEAHRSYVGEAATDDAEVFRAAGRDCFTVKGDPANTKVTYESDIPDARGQIGRYIQNREQGRRNRGNDEMFRRFIHTPRPAEDNGEEE